MRIVFKVIIGLFVFVLGLTGYTFWAIYNEDPSPVVDLNPESSMRKAIVISDPGITGFESSVASAFAEGLTDNWHVETTTASALTPTNLGNYTLVVFSSPIYGGEPSTPLQSYLTRLEPLNGVYVATLLTGAGSGEEAKAWMTSRIKSLGGTDIYSLVLYSMAPNGPLYGTTDPVAIALNAGQALQIGTP